MTTESTITVPKLFDAHVHLRRGEMTRAVAPHSARWCDRVLVMPNVEPPLREPAEIEAYRDECRAALGSGVGVLVTGKLWPGVAPSDVGVCSSVPGFAGWKLYPAGMTTNSGDGIPMADVVGDAPYLMRALEAMEKEDQALLVHGEAGGFVLDREEGFHAHWWRWRRRFPNLRMTFEHATAGETVSLLRAAEVQWPGKNLCTVTLHHMETTLDDVLGDGVRPDLYCKPVPKRPEDRKKLLEAALSGERPFAFGSDSAPHPRFAKYAACGCAGVFTAPVLGPALVGLFRKSLPGRWEGPFDSFTRTNAMSFYGVPEERNPATFTLAERPWNVPFDVGGVTPYRASQTLPLSPA